MYNELQVARQLVVQSMQKKGGGGVGGGGELQSSSDFDVDRVDSGPFCICDSVTEGKHENSPQ